MSIQRKHGAIQPGVGLGAWTLRVPFVHYRFEWADYLQGLLMCTVCLAIIPLLTEKLGMSFEVALAVVIINGTLYLAHVTFGDPVVPGWVTPAIPLLIVYVEQFSPGVERIQALIAFQFTFGLLCLVLGFSGLAKKFISLIPNAVQSSVLLGSGFAAVILVFKPGKGLKSFDAYPWTIIICVGFANSFVTLLLTLVSWQVSFFPPGRQIEGSLFFVPGENLHHAAIRPGSQQPKNLKLGSLSDASSSCDFAY